MKVGFSHLSKMPTLTFNYYAIYCQNNSQLYSNIIKFANDLYIMICQMTFKAMTFR